MEGGGKIFRAGFGRREIGDDDRKRFVPIPVFQGLDFPNTGRGISVRPQSIERFGRKNDDLSAEDGLPGPADELRVIPVRIDSDDSRFHRISPPNYPFFRPDLPPREPRP
jgi:hypothetical protein